MIENKLVESNKECFKIKIPEKPKVLILAGGKSKRMGQDKALLKFNDKLLLQYLVEDAIKYGYDDIFISVDNVKKYDNLKLPVTFLQDKFKDCGPLMGILTGLKEINKSCFILPCDAPLFSFKIISRFLKKEDENYDAIVTNYRGKVEPLFGIYKRSSIMTLEKQIKCKDLKVMSFLRKINYKSIEFNDENYFANMNYYNDYESFKKCIEKRRKDD